jgi:hypothetical protein
MSVKLREIEELASSDVKAAIVITESEPNQQHVGIAFIENDELTYSLAHLPFHHRPLKGRLTDYYYWVELRLSRARRLQIAARCREILASHPGGLPFAFTPPNDCFDKETGQSLLGPSGSGLTCATFVLAVFDSIGLPLVKWDTWPYRAKDILWQKRVVKALKERKAAGDSISHEHITAVEEQRDAVRCRPEEVAGSSTAPSFPLTFEEVEPLAVEVLAQLYSALGPRRPT